MLQNINDQVIAQFWQNVRRRLIDSHNRSAREADRGISQYRHELKSHGVGDTLYNQGVERTAAAVDALMDNPREFGPAQ